MAVRPRTLAFGNFKIWLGDGAEDEQFADPCGFTDKSLTITGKASEVDVPSCDGAVSWTERIISALSAAVQGSGVMDLGSVATWRNWMLSGASKNVRVEFADTGANGGGYYAGKAVLTDLGHSVALASDAGKSKQSVSMANDGEWTWTNNA